MKKFLALLLAMCMVLSVLPVLAESATDEAAADAAAPEKAAETDEGEVPLSGLLSDLFGQVAEELKNPDGLGGAVDKWANDLVQEFAAGELADQLRAGGKKLGGVILRLKDTLKISGKDLSGLLTMAGVELAEEEALTKALEGALDSLVSSLGVNTTELTPEERSNLLKELLNGGGLGLPDETAVEAEAETPELTDEDIAALEELANVLTKAEETGVPEVHKKNAESIDEFLGDWIQVRMYIGMDETDLSDTKEGLRITENGYIVTLNGEPEDPDYQPYANAKMELVDGSLLVTTENDQTTFVLTEEGNLVLGSDVFQIIFARVAQ